MSPDSLLLIVFAVGLLFLWRGKFYQARRVLSVLAGIILLIGFLPFGEWLVYSLEKQYPANPKLEKVDGIIMLGGAESPVKSHLWKQVVLGGSAERDFAFIRLVKKYPDAKAVYTGGSGSLVDQDYKGADVAKQLFNQQGLDSNRIIFERESRNTWENVIFSKKLLNPREDENWVLITSAEHMPRAMGIFCKANWKVTPYPVDYTSEPRENIRIEWDFSGHLGGLESGLREWVGIVAYRLTGKSC